MTDPQHPTPPPPPPPPPGGTPPPPPPRSSPPEPTPDPGRAGGTRAGMIVLAYLWVLAVIPLLAEPDDPETVWHAKHGLVLTAAELVVWVALFVVGTVLSGITGGLLGCVMVFVDLAVFVAFVAVHAVAMARGIRGERFRIPVVSDLTDRG